MSLSFQVTFHLKVCRCPFKWPSNLHLKRDFHNGSLETLICSLMWKIRTFTLACKCLFLIIFSLFLKQEIVSHFCREKKNENKQFQKQNKNMDWIFLMQYRCESDMPLCQWKLHLSSLQKRRFHKFHEFQI